MDRDWIRAAALLLGRLVPDGEQLRPLTVPFERDECEWFVRGWEADLYPVSSCPEQGLKDVCAPDRRDHFFTTSGRHRHLLTRWSDPPPWGLSREYVPHLAAFARAVLCYGYPREHSMLSHYGIYRRDLISKRVGGSYEVDAAFRVHASMRPWLLIEVKKEAPKVAAWAAAIDAAATATELVELGFKEVEYVLELDPAHLWLVGPGTVDPATHVWVVRASVLNVSFERLDDLPRFPR